MRCRPLALALAGLRAGACAPETVAITLQPKPGDEYRFRPEITGTITTTTDDDSPPQVTTLVTTLDATQLVRVGAAAGDRGRGGRAA
jgi:hypothetical protein